MYCIGGPNHGMRYKGHSDQLHFKVPVTSREYPIRTYGQYAASTDSVRTFDYRRFSAGNTACWIPADIKEGGELAFFIQLLVDGSKNAI